MDDIFIIIAAQLDSFLFLAVQIGGPLFALPFGNIAFLVSRGGCLTFFARPSAFLRARLRDRLRFRLLDPKWSGQLPLLPRRSSSKAPSLRELDMSSPGVTRLSEIAHLDENRMRLSIPQKVPELVCFCR